MKKALLELELHAWEWSLENPFGTLNEFQEVFPDQPLSKSGTLEYLCAEYFDYSRISEDGTDKCHKCPILPQHRGYCTLWTDKFIFSDSEERRKELAQNKIQIIREAMASLEAGK